jgi:hypothetical protein
MDSIWLFFWKLMGNDALLNHGAKEYLGDHAWGG